MATYTNLLRLITQATGENNNTWGASLNSGAISMIDDAIAGTVNISVTGADATLSVANGSTDESRNMIINVTGNPGVARNVIVPSLSKVYVVVNNTSPLQDVTVKTSAGSGVTLTAAATPQWVYCNATDVLAVTLESVSSAVDADSLGGFAAALYARLAANNSFTAGQATTNIVIDPADATPTPDLSLSNSFSYRPTVGFTFAKPTGVLSGQSFNLIIKVVSGAGGTFGAGYEFAAGSVPTIPSTVGEKWLFSFQYDSVDDVYVGGFIQDVS